jgi:hypothetical protein
MSTTRVFKCYVYEGTYNGEVTVHVNADLIEMYGNDAIEAAAWCEWRRRFGPSIGMAATGVKILEEIE